MLEELNSRPVQPDEDFPELSDEQLAEFAKAARERRRLEQNKQTVAIRLSPQALATARSLGKGYTSVLSRILESTLKDTNLLQRYL